MLSKFSMRGLAWTLFSLSLLACGLTANTDPMPTSPFDASTQGTLGTFAPIVTATRPPTLSALTPTQTPTMQATSLAETQIASTQANPCGLAEDEAAIRYTFDASLDPIRKTVSATETAEYVNQTGIPLSALVMNVDPNRDAGLFTLDSIEAADTSAIKIGVHNLNKARLEIALVGTLHPCKRAVLRLKFSVRVPKLDEARMKYFAYTERQVNVGHWYPEFAPFVGGVWQTPKQWSIGEYIFSETADFVANLVLQESTNYMVVAPGKAERSGERNWTFTFRRGRDFPILLTNQMSMINARTQAGQLIELHHFGSTPTPAHLHALETAVKSADRYNALYGTMPYDRLVVVEGDFADGMEFSGMVYVGHGWFANWPGTRESWLTLITAHEVAHQWFYALVMTPQGDAPYLDESLAIYSELLYLEQFGAEAVSWWWTFRVKSYQPKGYVDSPVYEYWVGRPYINAVYLRGASMLQAIRDALGDTEYFGWLKAYLEKGAGRIMSARDFWGAMTDAQYLHTAEIRLAYLRVPEVLTTVP